ncbi:MAG: amidohydrolase family protein [Cytophagales bacterium]|nr:amidohydrolase family protein [Cytophagales bacterium]
MLDFIIQGGLVVDGTGGEPYAADVGIKDGLVAAIGDIADAAKEVIDAKGAWVMPGFIDLHTHYDGQATWDDAFVPSIYHGVTTLVMGNCGVGFAPVKRGEEQRLIELMEGVEDIPGAALAEGVKWDWQSFPEYMAALEKTPRSLDYLVQVPHDPLRMFVMGERAKAGAEASVADLDAMCALLDEALRAGAAGFSTGRSDNHRTSRGQATPASESSHAELTALAGTLKPYAHGVIQVVNDFDVLRADDNLDAEFDLIEAMAAASNKRLSMTWLQRDPGATQHERVQARTLAARAKGLPLYLQTASRGIGVITGLDASFHLFMGCPAYQEIAAKPLPERALAMRAPKVKQRVLLEPALPLATDGNAVPPLVDILRAQIERISARMFPLVMDGKVNYEPHVKDSFYARAKARGTTAMEVIYDYLAEGDGNNLIYFPIFNYNEGNLNTVHQMLTYPHALFGLSDAGAHVGTVCDASFSTFMLTHWVQGLQKAGDPRQMALPAVVQALTQKQAQYVGLKDRGTLQIGMRADINVIDPNKLALGIPELVRDLPAGGRRFVQKASGYIGTWVAGQCVIRAGELTSNKPGKLVRMKG